MAGRGVTRRQLFFGEPARDSLLHHRSELTVDQLAPQRRLLAQAAGYDQRLDYAIMRKLKLEDRAPLSDSRTA